MKPARWARKRLEDKKARGEPIGEPPALLAAVGSYFLGIALGVDVLAASIIPGARYKTTLSYRIGKLKNRHGGKIPWTRPVGRILDVMLEAVDPGHSLDSYHHGRG